MDTLDTTQASNFMAEVSSNLHPDLEEERLIQCSPEVLIIHQLLEIMACQHLLVREVGLLQHQVMGLLHLLQGVVLIHQVRQLVQVVCITNLLHLERG